MTWHNLLELVRRDIKRRQGLSPEERAAEEDRRRLQQATATKATIQPKPRRPRMQRPSP